MIAWLPPGSRYGVGSVLLLPHQAQRTLTRGTYKLALACRISRLVNKEEPEDARALLQVVEDKEALRW